MLPLYNIAGPLVRVKQALTRVQAESTEMDLRIGVVCGLASSAVKCHHDALSCALDWQCHTHTLCASIDLPASADIVYPCTLSSVVGDVCTVA